MGTARETILVTGSSGLIGSAVVKRFAGPFTVIGFDTKRPQHLPPTADFVEVDLSSDESVGRSLRNVRECHGPQLASVIHLTGKHRSRVGGGPTRKRDTEQIANAAHRSAILRQVGIAALLASAWRVAERTIM